jgi:hypothetical protein
MCTFIMYYRDSKRLDDWTLYMIGIANIMLVTVDSYMFMYYRTIPAIAFAILTTWRLFFGTVMINESRGTTILDVPIKIEDVPVAAIP